MVRSTRMPLAFVAVSLNRTCSIIGGPSGLRFVALSRSVQALAMSDTAMAIPRRLAVIGSLRSPSIAGVLTAQRPLDTERGIGVSRLVSPAFPLRESDFRSPAVTGFLVGSQSLSHRLIAGPP